MYACTRWTWWFLLTAFAGCVTYQDRPLSPEKTLDDFESRTLDAMPLVVYLQENLTGDQPLGAAWGLPELTLAAFFYNPQLDIARARWAAAKGQERTAAERPNPALGLTPGFNSTTGHGGDISPWIMDVALDIPMETTGKRGYRMAEAQHLSEAARLNIAQAAWEVRRQVRQALVDLYAADKVEALIDLRRGLQADNVKLLEQLFEIGEISANELSQARILQDETDLARLEVGVRKAQARARLAAAIGVPARALESVPLSFEVLQKLPGDVPPEEARRRALLHREDLLAALSEYQASQAALQRAIAGQYPDIQLGPGYEFDQGDDKWMLGLSVSLPVFNRNQGAIASAEAKREEAAATFRDAQARIVGEIERAAMNYRASMKKVEATLTIANQVEQAADRARKMYDAGEILKTEVTGAELEHNASAARLLDARVETLQAFGQLEDAMHFAADLPEKALQIPNQPGAQQGDHDHEN
jgi:cobalt-zinc-cadmium efflux system outer membrane protein